MSFLRKIPIDKEKMLARAHLLGGKTVYYYNIFSVTYYHWEATLFHPDTLKLLISNRKSQPTDFWKEYLDYKT